MSVEVPTIEELFEIKHWWEEADWPIKKGDEVLANYFEDLRKRIWLLFNQAAGIVNIIEMYGLSTPLNGDQPVYIPYTLDNWAAGWAFGGTRNPGELVVAFQDVTGQTDIYINSTGFTQEAIILHPPVNAAGQIDEHYWKLGANPNKYHHCDFNAGRPTIGASNRWLIRYHPASPPDVCDWPHYICREHAYRMYPRQVDFLHQIPPIKEGSIITQRTKKVGVKNEYITKHPVTHWSRSLDYDPYHKCIKGRRLNEYTLSYGEPYKTALPVGQNWIDPLIDEAYQDQAIRACESSPLFVWFADEEWIENFIHYNADDWTDDDGGGDKDWAYGGIVYVSGYNPGDNYPEDCFYICKKDHTASPGLPKKPGTAAGADYWETPAYQPKYIDHNIEFPFMQDVFGDEIVTGKWNFDLLSSAEYWDCNGSSFELALKNIGRYDWYFDTGHPYVPWWVYKNTYGSPNDPPNYPLPRGTWRRTWKYSMGRPCHPETKVPYLLWPGELGDPPGYWTERSQIYKRLDKRFIVTQGQYDNITLNQDEYRVVDVESLYAQAVIDEEAEHGEGYVEQLLSRHDPARTDGDKSLFEIHNLINDLRYVLVQLRYVYKQFGYTAFQYYRSARRTTDPYPGPVPPKATSLAAHVAAKNIAMLETHIEWMGAPPPDYDWSIHLHSTVKWIGGFGWTGAANVVDTQMGFCYVRLEVYRGANKELPLFPYIGTMALHLGLQNGLECADYIPHGTYKRDPCAVGIEGKIHTPHCDSYDSVNWEHAFIGTKPYWEGWWWYGEPTNEWVYYTTWIIEPSDDWFIEEFFANADQTDAYKQWWKTTLLKIENTVPAMMEIDLEQFDASVFEEDEFNYIEV